MGGITVTLPTQTSQVASDVNAILTAMQPILTPMQVVAVVVVLAIGILGIFKAVHAKKPTLAATETGFTLLALFLVLDPQILLTILFKVLGLF